jgi:hypothetical protein
MTVIKCRSGSRATDLFWSLHFRFSSDSDGTAAPHYVTWLSIPAAQNLLKFDWNLSWAIEFAS